MKLLPYARRLLDRLVVDDRPWLVVLSAGGAGVQVLSRRSWFKDGKSAYVRVPDDTVLERADWGMFVALDVLLVPEAGLSEERFHAICFSLWRARIATLWALRAEGLADLKPRIFRLSPDIFPKAEGKFELTDRGVLPDEFRAALAARRQHALLMKEPPLYDDMRFDLARAERCAQLGLDPGVLA